MPPTFFAKGFANPASVLYLFTSFCLLLLSSLQPVTRFGNEEEQEYVTRASFNDKQFGFPWSSGASLVQSFSYKYF
jgi:hypothetical protein